MTDITLRGLDGTSPLAFLAALGVLRVLSLANPNDRVRMKWAGVAGVWSPVFRIEENIDEFDFSVRVFSACREVQCDDAFRLADDLTVTPDAYRAYMLAAAEAALNGTVAHADFAAALATDVLRNDDGRVQDTALRTMSGAGHQHFLGTIRNLLRHTEVSHVQKATLDTWHYGDPVQGMSMRWDPQDDVRYALRWSDPSGDPDRQKRGSMWGANRLAVEGLPLLPVMPTGHQLQTTGFFSLGARATFWTWPIWSVPASLDTVRSLLSLPELQQSTPDRNELAARGVEEIYTAQRLTVGKFRSFGRGVPFELADRFRGQ